MNNRFITCCIIFTLGIILQGLDFYAFSSPVDTYVFEDKVTEARFNALNKELRCPKCQNQNLADSNSPIAADLRREVYELLLQGKADIEIMHYMEERYGEFVLYRPKVNRLTYVLWFGPALLLLIGVLVVIFIIRKKPLTVDEVSLSSDEQNTLNALLSQNSQGITHGVTNGLTHGVTQSVTHSKKAHKPNNASQQIAPPGKGTKTK